MRARLIFHGAWSCQLGGTGAKVFREEKEDEDGGEEVVEERGSQWRARADERMRTADECVFVCV